jgi:hypothetical protein
MGPDSPITRFSFVAWFSISTESSLPNISLATDFISSEYAVPAATPATPAIPAAATTPATTLPLLTFFLLSEFEESLIVAVS